MPDALRCDQVSFDERALFVEFYEKIAFSALMWSTLLSAESPYDRLIDFQQWVGYVNTIIIISLVVTICTLPWIEA